jgi:tetratricopeptide (TPR) repeat protein
MAAHEEQRAIAARNAGNWEDARFYYGQSYRWANMGGASPQIMAGLYYEYARATGVTCDWATAEEYLKKSLNLRRSSGDSPTSINSTLVELGFMYLDKKDYVSAEQYLSEAYPLVKQIDSNNTYPAGVAMFLDEYATALEHVRKEAQAAPLRDRAKELRSASPTDRVDRTPYGTQCKGTPKAADAEKGQRTKNDQSADILPPGDDLINCVSGGERKWVPRSKCD